MDRKRLFVLCVSAACALFSACLCPGCSDQLEQRRIYEELYKYTDFLAFFERIAERSEKNDVSTLYSRKDYFDDTRCKNLVEVTYFDPKQSLSSLYDFGKAAEANEISEQEAYKLDELEPLGGGRFVASIGGVSYRLIYSMAAPIFSLSVDQKYLWETPIKYYRWDEHELMGFLGVLDGLRKQGHEANYSGEPGIPF